MVLKLYYDLLSQPSRALYIFFKLAKIPFEPCGVKLATGEHLTEEFKEKYSRFQKVPFIHDGDFKLAESIGILRYISREYPVPDNWYPKDSKKQAKADEFLEWQHMNLRLFCATYFQVKWLLPKITGKEATEEKLKFHYKEMIKTLNNFQNLFLTESKFMFGDEISYADVAAACELEQPRIAGYDPTLHYPKIKVWLDNVKKECSPFYQEAHAFLNKLAANTENQLKGKL